MSHSFGKGSKNSLLSNSTFTCEKAFAQNSAAIRIITFFILFFSFFIAAPQRVEAEESKTHYTYIDGKNGLGDLFYKNSAYYRCLTQNHCNPPAQTDQTKLIGPKTPPKKLAIFLKKADSREVIPSFLQCYEDGNSMVSMAEELIPVVNSAVAREDKCADTTPVEGVIPKRFVDDTLKALQGYDKKCKREDRSCMAQVVDGLENDLKNMFSLFGGEKSKTTKMGCLSTLVSNVVESLYSTLKLFLWDLPKGAVNFGKNLWNYMFEEEQETSTAMLYASVLPQNLAEALANWDLPKFYEVVRKNFFNFLGSIREFYTELLGCSEWSGAPYQSECLKKTNWSCPTCESVLNFTCGLAGQLGTGFLLGGVLGTGKSIIALTQLKKTISLSPKRFGISSSAIEEMSARAGVQDYLHKAGDAANVVRYKTSKIAKPMTSVLSTIGDEMKFVFGVGSAFKKFISSNPVTLPYHLTYQAGKNKAFKTMNNLGLDKGYFTKGSQALNLGRRYALHFKNIQDKYQTVSRDLYRLRGKRFNQKIYDEIVNDYLSTVKREMELNGVKVTRTDKGALTFEKGGEVFEYRPDWQERVKSQGAVASSDDFAKNLTFDDHLLDERNVAGLGLDRPKFLQDMMDKASDSKDIYTIKPDGSDGMVYLGHFTGQQKSVPKVKSCNDLLHDAEPLQLQEIQQGAPENATVEAGTDKPAASVEEAVEAPVEKAEAIDTTQ